MEYLDYPGEIRIGYKWAAGEAGTRFLLGLKEKRSIVGARCDRCQRTMVPPRLFCEECMGKASSFVDLAPRGKVETYSVNYYTTEARRTDKPWILAMISIEGSDGGLLHVLGEVSPPDVRIGMEVEAVFREDRVGSIQDIEYFRPATKQG